MLYYNIVGPLQLQDRGRVEREEDAVVPDKQNICVSLSLYISLYLSLSLSLYIYIYIYIYILI